MMIKTLDAVAESLESVLLELQEVDIDYNPKLRKKHRELGFL